MSDEKPGAANDEKPGAASDDKPGAASDDEEERSSPFGWFPIVMLIILVGGGLYLMFEMRDAANVQDCVQSGRKNCAPIDTTDLK